MTILAGSTGDREYIANWEIITYQIDYDLAGGEIAGENPAAYTVETGDFALLEPGKEGYTFVGWTGTGLADAKKNVTVAKGSTGDRSYTAVWTKNSHDVNYYVDGQWYKTVSNVSYGETLTAITAPTKTGYTFSGWSGLPETMPDGSVTVNGNFTANTYTVVFDGNGGSGTMADQAIVYDTPMNLTQNTFTLTGYTFGGWMLNGKVIGDGEAVQNLTEENGGIVTLAAIWEAGKDTAYTVYHYQQNANDG